jgi:hypothetical protein
MTILYVIGLSLLSGMFYMIGGRSKEDLSFAKGVWRDVGCVLCSCAVMVLLFGKPNWWQLLLFPAIQLWACRSYFQWFNDFLLCVKCAICDNSYLCPICTEDVFYKSKHWWNWLLVGIVANSKWLIFGVPLWVLGVKALAVMVASELCDDAKQEEFLRGIFII